MSGNNVTGATIEVQSVKYGMTGENVPFYIDPSIHLQRMTMAKLQLHSIPQTH